MPNNVWTLDAMREELENEYAPMTIDIGREEIVLQSLMRIDKLDRDAVIERMREMEGDDENDLSEDETIEAVKFITRRVTADGKAERLIRALGDDLLLYMKVMQKWQEATQPGEAQDSPS